MMGENNGNCEVLSLSVKDGEWVQAPHVSAPRAGVNNASSSCFNLPFLQKMIAEVVGTYFCVFAGCGAMAVNLDKDHVVTFPGIAIVWGLVFMAMIYCLGHVSGSHFNPAVTFAFATCGRHPWKQVIPYLICQVLGSILASGTLYLILNKNRALFLGTCSSPSGSDVQSFVVEFIITFYLMFVICGVDTDERAVKAQAGLAIGVTVLLNVMFAGPISGASMNPARSLGPAIISSHYKDIWIYIVGPMSGAVFGAWTYNLVRFTDKPLREITMSDSFLRGTAGRNNRR